MMLIAHRGASGSAPENTLAAFRKAIELGADYVELDVCASRDRHIVVFHDDALERTTDGRGLVCDQKLAQLKRLDAGSWFDPRFAREKIPTLYEVIRLVKPTQTGLFIEMKPGPHLDGAFEQALTRLLVREEMTARSFVMSFNHAAVGRVKELDPNLRGLLLAGRRTPLPTLLRAVQAHRADGVSVKVSLVNESLVSAIHQRGLRVVVWTANSPRQMRRLVRLGVDGITTDFPERLAPVQAR